MPWRGVGGDDVLLEVVLIIVGFAMIIKAADMLVDAASDLAARFGVPDRVVGLTIVSVGTSLPELVVGISSATTGAVDMAFGNVMGSCVANLLLILGVTSIITPVPLSRRTQRVEIPLSIAAFFVLLAFANTGAEVVFWEGLVLTVLFAAFIVETAIAGLAEGKENAAAAEVAAEAGGAIDAADKDVLSETDRLAKLAELKTAAGEDTTEVEAAEQEAEEAAHGRRNPLVNLGIIAVSIVLLKVGADLVVDNCTTVATALGVSERIIGVTIVALGTCLPELVTSVVAAFRGNTDIAVGNVVGSNISNVLLVMGVPSMLATMTYDTVYNFDFAVAIVCSAALILFARTGEKDTMTRVNGVMFVLVYVGYLVLTAWS